MRWGGKKEAGEGKLGEGWKKTVRSVPEGGDRTEQAAQKRQDIRRINDVVVHPSYVPSLLRCLCLFDTVTMNQLA